MGIVLFPPFPDLPDDNPVEAMRLVRDWLRAVINYLSIYQLLAVSVVLPISVLLLVWKFLDLSWAADLIPVFFAVISIVVTVKEVQNQHQTPVIVFILIMGFVGTFIMHADRTRNNRDHHSEIDKLQSKIELVSNQNFQVLQQTLKHVPSSQEAEIDRRKNIADALRGEYILSHNNISAGLLAGIENPPNEWMNNRLRELGEKWTMSESPIEAAPSSLRSDIVFVDFPDFGVRRDDKGDPVPQQEQGLHVGEWFYANISYKQVGPNPVESRTYFVWYM
jgi:hypothetical protein